VSYESDESQAARLEGLWSGDFGDDYVTRNATLDPQRGAFWARLLTEIRPRSVLEVGCNLGGNLAHITQHVEASQVYGVDVNAKALATLRRTLPDVNAVHAVARDLPFRDRLCDLVFTTGVLIHQPDSTLPLVMAEVVRCSRRYVLAGEYYSKEPVEIPYRGVSGALFKRDYGRLYAEYFPELTLVRTEFLSKAEGWDDVTFWLFERA
jgi:pseudaminic acid biosynthesis-associated methylase